MSPSSSGSWGAPGDIIDLDRYMRGNVRPSALSDDSKRDDYERLVVDGGGGGCKQYKCASGDARYKRASLDSGVSDGSYRHTRHTHTKHRRGSYREDSSFYPPHEPALTKTLSNRENSTSSMREFRTVCERALLEQQQQIARVAQLCELLTERAEKSEKAVRSEQIERNKSLPKPERIIENDRNERLSKQSERLSKQSERLSKQSEQSSKRKERKAPSSVDSSELSSSSRSTKDPRRKETNRTQECKTYKIIMSKLDELNRLFATRPPRPAHPARAPRTPSSSSVSVCDKLVATDPQRSYNRVLAPTQRVRCLAASSAAPASLTSAARSSRHASARAVTQAFSVDIAPQDRMDVRANVLTESIVKCESSCESNRSACDPRCGFDLEDPVHLYAQAKRLQNPTVRARRTRSVEPTASAEPWLDAHVHQHREHVCEHARAPSLCAVCRGYWRYLRQCVPALARAVDTCKCS